MASVRQRGKAKTWYALYRDADGVQVQKALKAESRRQALEMAEELENAARPRGGVAAAERMREIVSAMHRKLVGVELPRMSVRGFCDHWLGLRGAEIGPDGRAAYRHALMLFLEHLGPRAEIDLHAVQRQDIVTFRDALMRRLAPSTAANRLKIVRMLFKAAADDKWIPDNPCRDVRQPKTRLPDSQPKRRDFTTAELRAVLRACPNNEWRGLVLRSYYTGQRMIDICLILADQEDPHAQTVRFRTHKTGKVVILPMHPAYVDWVLTQPAADNPRAPLHPWAHASVSGRIAAGKHTATVTVSGRFRAILAKAGLRDPAPHRRKEGGQGRRAARQTHELVFHGLRHSFVSHLASAGVSAGIVRDMVGHDNVRVNQGYTHIEQSVKSDAIRRLPNILEG